jgi:flagellar biosynthesis/type III secretory pathway protein FliH
MRKLINNIRERFERTVIMMAILFAQRVILGKCEFEQVPKKLRKQVAEILIDEAVSKSISEHVTEVLG